MQPAMLLKLEKLVLSVIVRHAHAKPQSRGLQLTEPRSRTSILDCGYYKKLPESYRKFYTEWKLTVPEPVHYVPKEGKYKKDPITGEVDPIQNVAIPLVECPQEDDCIWGGESVIQGYVRILRGKHRIHDLGPAPRFWFPRLRNTVIYSEILDKHMVAVLTRRAILKINDHYGLDHYLLKNRACDLRNLLALKLKRKLLLALLNKTMYPENEDRREEVYNKYKHYLESYTPEEIEWYGLSLAEASMKLRGINTRLREESIVPLKHQFRKDYVELLKNEELKPIPPPEPWRKKKLISFK